MAQRARLTVTESITVTISPEPDRVRVLAMTPTHDVLMAILGPISAAHPRAAATFLEGLALWYEQTLSVVLCADDSVGSYGMGLCDALGFGRSQLHFEVGIAVPPRRRSQRAISGLGDFRDLRQLSLSTEWSR